MVTTSCFTCPVKCQAFIALSNIQRVLKNKGNVQLGLFVKPDVYRPMKIPKRRATDPGTIPLKKPKTTAANPSKPPTSIPKNHLSIKPSPQVRKLLNVSDRAPTLVDQSPGTSEIIQDDDRLSKDVVTGKEQFVTENIKVETDSEPEVIFVKEKENSTPAKTTPNPPKKSKVSPSQSEASSSTVKNSPRKEASTSVRNPTIVTSSTSGTSKVNEVSKSTNDTSGQSSNVVYRIPPHRVDMGSRLLPNSSQRNHANTPSSASVSKSIPGISNRPNVSRTSWSSESSSSNMDNLSSLIPSSPDDLLNTILPSILASASSEISKISKSTRRDSGVSTQSSSISIQIPSPSITDMPVTPPDIPWHSNQTDCTMTEVRLVAEALQGRQLTMHYFHPDVGCQDDFLRSAFSAYISQFRNMRLSRKPATVKISKFLIHPHRESNLKGVFRVKVKHYGKPTWKRLSLCLWNPKSGYIRSPFSELPGIYEEEEFECPIMLSQNALFYFVMITVSFEENSFFLPPVATSFALNKVLVVTLDKNSQSRNSN